MLFPQRFYHPAGSPLLECAPLLFAQDVNLNHFLTNHVTRLTRYHFVVLGFQPVVHGNPGLYVVWWRVELDNLKRTIISVHVRSDIGTSARGSDGGMCGALSLSATELAILQGAVRIVGNLK